MQESDAAGTPTHDEHPAGPGGGLDGLPADVRLRTTRPDLHVLHQEQLPEDVTALSIRDGRRGEGMRLLPVVPLPTDGGPQLLEAPGGREGTEEGRVRHHQAHGAGRVRAQGHHASGLQQVPGEGDLQDVSQVSEHRGARQGQGEDGSQGTYIGDTTSTNFGDPVNELDSGGQRHLPSVQGVHEVAEQPGQPIEPRLMRKIKGALTQSASFWKIIKDLLSSTGLDDDATTKKLKCCMPKLHKSSWNTRQAPCG